MGVHGEMLRGAFGSRLSITETLTRATPLILTGLAAAVAFRARLWNIGGELTVQLAVEPALQPGHELQIFLDGVRVAEVPQGQSQFTISEVFRGERQLRAVIVDERGRELASSATIRFYVQQASLLNPNRPGRPAAGGG